MLFRSLTFIATVGPAFHRGAKLVFVDSDATGNIDISLLEEALESLRVKLGSSRVGATLNDSKSTLLHGSWLHSLHRWHRSGEFLVSNGSRHHRRLGDVVGRRGAVLTGYVPEQKGFKDCVNTNCFFLTRIVDFEKDT